MPYKLGLLVAMAELVREGAIGQRLPLAAAIESVYRQILGTLFPDWEFPGRMGWPWSRLATDGLLRAGAGVEVQADVEALLHAGASWQAIAARATFMELDPGLHEILAEETSRNALLAVLDDRLKEAGAVCPLFSVIGTGALAAPAASPAGVLERHLEDHLVENWAASPFAATGVEIHTNMRGDQVGRQFITPVGIMDILGWQESAATWWVLELKRGRPDDRVVGQIQRYLGWVELRMGRQGETAKGAVLAQTCSEKLKFSIEANPKLTLWEFDDSFAPIRVV